jgi:MSHA pilin protein MshC
MEPMRAIIGGDALLSRVSGQAGFTLAELILIILIVSVLAIVAAPRFSPEPFSEAAVHQELISALRYAQKLAINTGCEIQVQISAASDSFSVTRRSGGSATSCGAGAFGDSVANPAGTGNLQATAPSDVDLLNDLTVVFDSLGLPNAGGSVSVDGRLITVEAASGYVR